MKYVFLTIVALFAPAVSHACSCIAGDPAQAFVEGNIVFRGTVTAVEENQAAYTKSYTFSVDTVWQGPDVSTITISTGLNSAACGMEWAQGSTQVVVADSQQRTSLCSYVFQNDNNEYVTLEDLVADRTPLYQGISCQPYICNDGTQHPACTQDGHPISYFAHPCHTDGPPINPETPSFIDVSVNHPYFEAIDWAQQEGIVQGYTDGTFRASNTINRAEFMKIMVGALEMNTNILCRIANFPDAPMSEWYGAYVQAARCAGLVNGYPDGTFRPSSEINFVEAAKIIALAYGGQDVSNQAAGSNPWYIVYVDYLDDHGAIPSSIQYYDAPITRGEMVYMMYILSSFDGGDDITVCTQEAKQCPDGSWVGREGPNCEFAPCPPIACTLDVKECPDGSYVGRTGPNCEFVCPAGGPAESEAECDDRGGTWQPAGLLGNYMCIEQASDGGDACSNDSDCEEICLYEMGSAEPGDAVTGYCRQTNNPFGCYCTVEDGIAGPCLCVD